MTTKLSLLSALVAVVRGQLAGTLKPETHPSLIWEKCTTAGGCASQNGAVVIDANWRWVHNQTGTNCYSGNNWVTDVCNTDAECAAMCAIDGADYEGTYGITTSGNELSIQFVTQGQNTNIGSRLYLMADDSHYEMFTLANAEFTFDVNVSDLPCGLNGALYFVSMDADGGLSRYSGNQAGAKYGTGYCDSQCPRDLKFINGQANVEGWIPSSTSKNNGVGNYGSCCPEMDIWEANSVAEALTPHPCSNLDQQRCDGNDCGGTYSDNRYAGTCDPDGCDFNPYRQGAIDFFGPGKTVDSNSIFTVVTQFIGSPVTEIRRIYLQNGEIIANAQSQIPGVPGNSITTEFCDAQKQVFNNTDSFGAKGGMPQMSQALGGEMVLVMSLWDDYYSNMLWLDSDYPVAADASEYGISRGTCNTNSGTPAQIEGSIPNSKVKFSNIRFGEINSTFVPQ